MNMPALFVAVLIAVGLCIVLRAAADLWSNW
jgi:hypothetical protein